MYKRKDNNIFGINQGYSPRIQNDHYIDPFVAFKNKTEQNYQDLMTKVDNIPKKKVQMTKKFTKVNQEVKFQQNYHKTRKQIDLQSSIFYPPTPNHLSRNNQQSNKLLISNKSSPSITFGRKQTLNRQIKKHLQHDFNIKGNQSHLFGLTNREEQLKIMPNQQKPSHLIPIKMKWADHDSIIHSQINYHTKTNNKIDIISHSIKPIHPNIQECQLVSENNKPLTIFQQQKQLVVHNKVSINKLKKAKSQGKIIENKNQITEGSKYKEIVQIQIIRGWNHKFLEGLSKNCKFNQTQIVKFQSMQEGKARLHLKKTKKWQNVTDWLRIQAHLKIRVLNK